FASDGRPVPGQGARLLQPLHLLEAAGGDGPRDLQPLRAWLRGFALLRKAQRGGGVGALAEDEAEEIVVRHPAQERQGLFVLLLRLIGKADDDVARKRYSGAG